MKKVFLIIALFAFASTAIISCKKSPIVNCISLMTKANDAGSVYLANPTIANCRAAKTACINVINSTQCSESEKLPYRQQKDAYDILCP
jgi:hypothetical protein